MTRSVKHQAYLDYSSKKNVTLARAEYEVRRDTRERDLKALQKLQEGRPMKPPGAK